MKKRRKPMTCYHCGRPAVSRDHVPPLSFFPPGGNPDLRRNLMKVPSCQLHNGGKALDDDYVRMTLSAISKKINETEKLQYLRDHTVNALVNSEALYALMLKDIRVDTRNGKNSVSGEINPIRIANFMSSVARGLLYYERELRWRGEVISLVHFLIDESSPQELRDQSQTLLIGETSSGASGENKDVFYFHIFDLHGDASEFSVDMCFYREFHVTTFFKRASPKETDLPDL